MIQESQSVLQSDRIFHFFPISSLAKFLALAFQQKCLCCLARTVALCQLIRFQLESVFGLKAIHYP
jgi:hypothetical protein